MPEHLTKEGAYVSRELGEIVMARNGECFNNAISVLPFAPDGSVYVEGVALCAFLLVHHGWLVTPDGMIIDPTPSYYDPGRILGPAKYFEAVRFSFEEVLEFAAQDNALLPVLGWDGRELENKRYRAAYIAAMRESGYPHESIEPYIEETA